MADRSRTAHARYESGAGIDAPTMSERGVEIVVPESCRLPREANRALVNVIMAVRDRTRGAGKEVA